MTAADPTVTLFPASAGERLRAVEVGLTSLGASVSTMSTQLDRVEATVQGRPSWLAATLLSFSTFANGALLAAVVALITTRPAH